MDTPSDAPPDVFSVTPLWMLHATTDEIRAVFWSSSPHPIRDSNARDSLDVSFSLDTAPGVFESPVYES